MEDAVVPNDENNNDDILDSDIYPPNNILETEGVDRTGNETEEKKIEGVDSGNEGVESYNGRVDNEVLPPERKGYRLMTPPPI